MTWDVDGDWSVTTTQGVQRDPEASLNYHQIYKRRNRLGRQKVLRRELTRTQRYLGLRPVYSDSVTLDATESVAGHNGRVKRKKGYNGQIHALKPLRYDPDGDVVFVSIDLEAYEHNQSIITEIGVSTLDTRDLRSYPPGLEGQHWHHAIRARHFRISEYSHKVNKKWVRGCPEKFGFGKSEWVRLHEAADVIASCFRFPFSSTSKYASAEQQKGQSQIRNIVFVGHDPQSDVKYLQTLGFDIKALPNLWDVVDTASLFRALKHESNKRSLTNILTNLKLKHEDLHNAGNDACYTLQAMIGIAFRDMACYNPVTYGPPLSDTEQDDGDYVDRAYSDDEGWSTGDENEISVMPPLQREKITAAAAAEAAAIAAEKKMPQPPTVVTSARSFSSMLRSCNGQTISVGPSHYDLPETGTPAWYAMWGIEPVPNTRGGECESRDSRSVKKQAKRMRMDFSPPIHKADAGIGTEAEAAPTVVGGDSQDTTTSSGSQWGENTQTF
ncbi:MAG: hypothetical protein M1817_005324 [Caeruleum heppii]|nr:MAG: hypothetical protein M1817_005324 [Caeruleum heppii]